MFLHIFIHLFFCREKRKATQTTLQLLSSRLSLKLIHSERFPRPSVSLDDAKICMTLPDNDLWNGQAGSIKGKRIFVWGQSSRPEMSPAGSIQGLLRETLCGLAF